MSSYHISWLSNEEATENGKCWPACINLVRVSLLEIHLCLFNSSFISATSSRNFKRIGITLSSLNDNLILWKQPQINICSENLSTWFWKKYLMKLTTTTWLQQNWSIQNLIFYLPVIPVSMEKEILCMIRSPCHQTVDTQSTAPLVLLYSRMSAQITKFSFWPHVVPWLPFPFPKLPI